MQLLTTRPGGEMQAEVFISYSSKNKELADAIVQKLEGNGISCWYAPRNISSGREWVSAINDAIEGAKVFLFLYTEESNASRQVANEIALAFNEEKIILPYCTSDVPMNKEIKYYLTRVHWLNAVGIPREEGLEALCRRMKELLGDSPGEEQKEKTLSLGETSQENQESVKRSKTTAILAWTCLAVAALAVLLIFVFARGGGRQKKESEDLYQKGYELWEAGSREEAAETFEKAADQGCLLGRLALGTLWADELTNVGKKKWNQSEIQKRLQELETMGEALVRDGCLEGNYLLGVCTAEGFEGIQEKKEKATRYFETVLQGKEEAWLLRSYGYLCMMHGISQGETTANPEKVDQYSQAAEMLLLEKGWKSFDDVRTFGYELRSAYGEASVMIGDAYRGLSLADQAFPWYVRAAEAGMPAAMNQLGLAYLRGEGVEENAELAKTWFQRAADAGDENALKNLEFVK